MSLYRRALGPAFDALPEPIRALHLAQGVAVWRGRATTKGASSPLAALLARLLGFPPAQADCEVEVVIDASPGASAWRRTIGGAVFSSALSDAREGGLVRERFGPATMDLRLTPDGDRLIYAVEGWRLGPAPMPRFLGLSTRAHETVDPEGRFVFDVEISMALIGRLAGYRGWLTRVD